MGGRASKTIYCRRCVCNLEENKVYVLVFHGHGLCTTSFVPGDAKKSGVRLKPCYSPKYSTQRILSTSAIFTYYEIIFISSLHGRVSGKAGTREVPVVQSHKRLDLGSAVQVQGIMKSLQTLTLTLFHSYNIF